MTCFCAGGVSTSIDVNRWGKACKGLRGCLKTLGCNRNLLVLSCSASRTSLCQEQFAKQNGCIRGFSLRWRFGRSMPLILRCWTLYSEGMASIDLCTCKLYIGFGWKVLLRRHKLVLRKYWLGQIDETKRLKKWQTHDGTWMYMV